MKSHNLGQYLKSLDFTPSDESVYAALIETGPTHAGELIKRTRLHRNVVYTALQHLADRKLVTEKLSKGKKLFSINSPQALADEYQKKAALAKLASELIQKQLPEKIDEITIHQGNEEYLDLLTGIIRTMPVKSTKYVLGTGGEAFMTETMLPIWKQYHKAAKERGLKIKMIGYEPQRKSIDPDIQREGIYEMRYLPQNLENPSGVHIYPEAGIILNIIYSDEQNPVTAIKMNNKKLVDGYLNLFNNLWAMGRG
jgi:sugar-specific transcriptional regulator TrmB